MSLHGNCLSTAMGILPHTSVYDALQLALSLDVPFWPQLPNISYYEDMYVQASEGFPGIEVDENEKEIGFSQERFFAELTELAEHWEDPAYFRLSEQYSQTFHAFMQRDLRRYRHVRGQIIGPISFGLSIVDNDGRPIIYDRQVREILFPFMQKKLRAQRAELDQVHPAALVWIDEPGLEMLFTAFTGYTGTAALSDYGVFLADLPRPRGVHLCGNPDWSFLLQLDIEVLSFDALANGHIMVRYFDAVREFLDGGGVLSWGITPTLTEELGDVQVEDAVRWLEELWGYLDERGLPKEQVFQQSWIAPARCCLINDDGDRSVEESAARVRAISRNIRQRYGLS